MIQNTYFNNLAKSLNVCIYYFYFVNDIQEANSYLSLIDKKFNTFYLETISKKVSSIINAKILNTSSYSFNPFGASAVMILSDNDFSSSLFEDNESNNLSIKLSNSLVVQLDKSHITAHTYLEKYSPDHINVFRIDFDLSTCGEISPTKSLDFLLRHFNPHLVTIDYRVRGITRNNEGKKSYIDEKIDTIQELININIQKKYSFENQSIHNENIFYTKMMTNEYNFKDFISRLDENTLNKSCKYENKRVFKEIETIFSKK